MDDLLSGLNNTKAEIVLIKRDQVISLIGAEATEDLHEGILEIQSTMSKKKNSIIPKHKRVKKEIYGRFNRIELIKAIQHASATSNNHTRIDNESERV